MAAIAIAGRSLSERLVDFLDIIECRPVTDDHDREAIFRLRYDAYVREGTIPRSFSRRFADDYDDSPNVWIFGVHIGDRLASSIRIHIASPEHKEAPATSIFPDILLPEIERGATIVDPTRFVADHAMSRLHPELPYVTVRLAVAASEHFEADLSLATVRTEHQAFYKRTFGFQPICEPREYPNLAKPISLMGVKCSTFRDTVMGRHPFLASTPEERAMLFDRTPLAPALPAPARPEAQPVFNPAFAS